MLKHKTIKLMEVTLKASDREKCRLRDKKGNGNLWILKNTCKHLNVRSKGT